MRGAVRGKGKSGGARCVAAAHDAEGGGKRGREAGRAGGGGRAREG